MEQDIRLCKVFQNITPSNVHVNDGYVGKYGHVKNGVYEEHLLNEDEQLLGIISTLTPKELVVTPTFIHETYGRVAMLNDVSDVVESNEYIKDIKKVWFNIVSNSAIEGDIVLIPILNEVELDPIVVSVTATLTTKVIEVSGSGVLFLKRDHANVLDTLKDTDVVSAIFTDITVGKMRLV